MSIQESIRYGAAELKRFYNRNLGMALGISVGFHLLLILLYIFITSGHAANEKGPPVVVGKMKLENIAPPPEDKPNAPPPPPPMVQPQLQTSTGNGGVNAVAGAPVAVPDIMVNNNFATTTQISAALPQAGDGSGFNTDPNALQNVPLGEKKADIGAGKEEIPPEDEFIAVEKDAVVDLESLQKRVVYPDIARRTGVEGKVTVSVYIDKTGKPVKTKVSQSDNKLLEQAAIDAIMKGSYPPAIQNGNPVGEWVSIPVVFTLH